MDTKTTAAQNKQLPTDIAALQQAAVTELAALKVKRENIMEEIIQRLEPEDALSVLRRIRSQ